MGNAHLPQKCPNIQPIMVFSKRLDMHNISVILLQYQKQIMSANLIISLKE